MKKNRATWPPLEAHSCEHCGFSTPLVSDLFEHMRKEHPPRV